jgi:hypothetical protein
VESTEEVVNFFFCYDPLIGLTGIMCKVNGTTFVNGNMTLQAVT